MATNTGKGFRQGAVTARTQVQMLSGKWMKRDEGSGRFLAQKSSDGPWKGVAKEPDRRDTSNA